MATCKECTHYDVCGNKKEILSSGIRALDSIDVENVCPYFKDRSCFVELPYKLGDVVYFIFERKVIGCVVRRISFDNTKFGANITLDSLDDNNYGTIYGLLADDDCEFFLTREEAEKALKGRKNNDD